MNNEENKDILEQEGEQQIENEIITEEPVKKKKDKIFVILAVIAFLVTAALVFMLVTKTGDGQSTVFQRVFNLDMTKLDKERKKEEPPAEPPQESNEPPVIEEKKEELKKKEEKKDTSKNNSNSKPSSSNNNSNNSLGNSSSGSSSSSSSSSTVNKYNVIHYAYIHKDAQGRINAAQELNRGDVAQMISEINHLDISKKYDTSVFKDYSQFPSNYAQHILAGYYAGYWAGYGSEGNRTYRYNKPVSKNSALVFIMRVIDINKLPVEEKCKQINFTDLVNSDGTPLDQGEIDRIHKASRMCLIYGETGTNKFYPNQPINKLQFVTILSRAYGRENSKEECDSFPTSSPFSDYTAKNNLNYYRLIDAYMTRKCTK